MGRQAALLGSVLITGPLLGSESSWPPVRLSRINCRAWRARTEGDGAGGEAPGDTGHRSAPRELPERGDAGKGTPLLSAGRGTGRPLPPRPTQAAADCGNGPARAAGRLRGRCGDRRGGRGAPRPRDGAPRLPRDPPPLPAPH